MTYLYEGVDGDIFWFSQTDIGKVQVNIIEPNSLLVVTEEIEEGSKLFEQITQNQFVDDQENFQYSFATAAPKMLTVDSYKVIAFSKHEVETALVYFYDIEQKREIVEVKNAFYFLHIFEEENLHHNAHKLLFR